MDKFTANIKISFKNIIENSVNTLELHSLVVPFLCTLYIRN